ncbi:hypothetical protein HYH03_016919 [Edaphochlamys debaryana]|uniref:Protein kinase domain-containing protein n=1 Tax=Edaphochlamys debaryana TaxID=47281 RepID=A0A835XIZ8_9CHLO|nr:hypothetical protein HYH03_016919 [Edaphochlamys debaryana]|eukprot:KAG2484275.1 hypothetical protein HYH03_016919 [Edaphochlamys debaryana]
MQAYEYISTAHEDKAIMRLAVREARVLEGLDHPNLVKMLAAFKSKSGRVYLVFEFVGPSLHAQLDLQPTGLAPPATKLLAWQLINGVSYLHDAKILHRDIKPANVLLCPSGVAKLCDFGFARSVSCGPRDVQRCTTYCVTRWYRAPEVLVGDLYGAAADVWSIGCTLAETATGRALFPGNSTTDQLYRVMSCLGPLAPLQAARMSMNPRLAPMAHTAPLIRKTLRQRLPELEPRLFELIEACLQVDPRRRPTVRELLQMPYFWDARRVAASVPPVDKLMVAAAAGEFTNLKRTPPPSASQPKTPAPGLERRPTPESSVQAPVERTALPASGALPAAAAAAAADAAPPTEPASAAPNCRAPNCQAVDASFMASSDTCGTPGTTTTVASPPSSQPASSRATLAGPGSIAAAASAVTASAMLHAVAAVAEARRQAAASLTAVADQDPQLCGGGRCNARPRATSAVASCGPDGVIPARPPAVNASRDTGSNPTAKAAAAMLLVSPVKAAPAGAAAATAASPATAMASMPPAPGSWAGRVSSGFGFLPSLTMGPKASFGRGAGSVLGDTWDEAATPVGAPELHGQPGFVPPHVRPSTRALNSLEHRRLGSVPSLALAETKGARLLLRCATAVGELLDLGTSRRESSVGSIGSAQRPCASSARAKGASASATGEDRGTSASTGANVVGCESAAWATAPLARLLTSNPIASVKEEDEEGTDGGTSRQLAATTTTAASTTAGGGGGEAVLGSSMRKSCSQPDFFDLHRRQQEAAAAGAAAHAAHAAHTVSTVDAQDVESLHTTAPASSAQGQGRGLDPDQGLFMAVVVAAASASSVIASASSNRSLSHTVPRPLSPCIEQAAPGTAAAHAAGLDVPVHDSSASTGAGAGAGAVQAFALSVGQVAAALGSGRWCKAEEGGPCCDVEVEVLPPPDQAAAQEAAGAAAGAATAPGACNAVAHVSMPESDRGHKGVAPRAKGGKGWVRTIQKVLACGVRRM